MVDVDVVRRSRGSGSKHILSNKGGGLLSLVSSGGSLLCLVGSSSSNLLSLVVMGISLDLGRGTR